jgi:hypothetical protein
MPTLTSVRITLSFFSNVFIRWTPPLERPCTPMHHSTSIKVDSRLHHSTSIKVDSRLHHSTSIKVDSRLDSFHLPDRVTLQKPRGSLGVEQKLAITAFYGVFHFACCGAPSFHNGPLDPALTIGTILNVYFVPALKSLGLSLSTGQRSMP